MPAPTADRQRTGTVSPMGMFQNAGSIVPDSGGLHGGLRGTVACNAQSDDFRFKVTIRNNSNDYLSILDVVSPDAVHIDSWLYPYEDVSSSSV